jgi:hypothetical protein
MIRKHWTRQNAIVNHLALALVWGSALYILQLPWLGWQKLAMIVCSTIAITLLMGFIGRYIKGQMVKVLAIDFETATRIVQYVLFKKRIPFSKDLGEKRARFEFRVDGLELIVEDYPLNLPLDLPHPTGSASKFTIKGSTGKTRDFIQTLCRVLDEGFQRS